MCVLKIIQEHHEAFDIDPKTINTEKEALNVVTTMVFRNQQQMRSIIRQQYCAICNLFEIGLQNEAAPMAEKLIPLTADEKYYSIASELCILLIQYYNHLKNENAVKIYTALYDKFISATLHQNRVAQYLGKVAYGPRLLDTIEPSEMSDLLKSINASMPLESSWTKFYTIQIQSLCVKGQDLEELYLNAIEYYRNLYYQHSIFISFFTERIIEFYQRHGRKDEVKKWRSFL